MRCALCCQDISMCITLLAFNLHSAFAHSHGAQHARAIASAPFAEATVQLRQRAAALRGLRTAGQPV